MTLSELLRKKREDILRVCAQYGAHNVRVFGSVACGEADGRATWTFWLNSSPAGPFFDPRGAPVRGWRSSWEYGWTS